MVSKWKWMTFLAVLLMASSLASAQVVNVSPVPGNPTASGTNLLNAVAGIIDASPSKPYVVRVAPGIYDVGNTALAMKQNVDIEGSGQQSTIIRGNGNNAGFLIGVVQGASRAEIRNLQIQVNGTGFSNGIALLLNQASTSVRDVTLASNGATSAWGLRSLGSSPTIQNVTITVRPAISGATASYGISCTGGTSTTPVIRRAVITVAGGSMAHGIYADQLSTPRIRDAEIAVAGGTAYGIKYTYTDVPSSTLLEVTSSKIVAGGTNGASGIDLDANLTVAVTHTNIVVGASSGSGIGLKNSSLSFTSTFLVDHCDVEGSTNSISAPFQTARVGASKLKGPASIGVATCVATLNGNYASLNASCL